MVVNVLYSCDSEGQVVNIMLDLSRTHPSIHSTST